MNAACSDNHPSTQAGTEYIPPSPIVVDKYVNDVTMRLQEQGHRGCDDPDVIQGLASFLNMVALVTAKNLNRKGRVAP